MEMSLEDKQTLQNLWDNTIIITVNGVERVFVNVPYKRPPSENFLPEKTNMSSAIQAVKRIVRQLSKKVNNDLQEYVDQINKAVKQGTLVQLSKKFPLSVKSSIPSSFNRASLEVEITKINLKGALKIFFEF